MSITSLASAGAAEGKWKHLNSSEAGNAFDVDEDEDGGYVPEDSQFLPFDRSVIEAAEAEQEEEDAEEEDVDGDGYGDEVIEGGAGQPAEDGDEVDDANSISKE